jgi:predicted hotdog family 3-hydroxylacyl-ACP dehydratase
MNEYLHEDKTDRQPGASAIELEAQVLSRIGRRVSSFHVVVVEKGLILKGRSLSYHVKQLAQQAVMSATSIPIVRNEIEVASGNHEDS